MTETHANQQLELPTYNFDLNFRPATYWSEAKAVRANVTGTLRRAALEEALRAKDDRAARAALDDRLGAASREMLGVMHPSFRSGEDLRPVSRHEVEIARIELKSVHGEVTSIRARLRNGRIFYRVEDECANEFDYPLRHAHSTWAGMAERVETGESQMTFQRDNRPEMAEQALVVAHQSLLDVLQVQCKWFKLPELGEQLLTCFTDFAKVWSPDFLARLEAEQGAATSGAEA